MNPAESYFHDLALSSRVCDSLGWRMPGCQCDDTYTSVAPTTMAGLTAHPPCGAWATSRARAGDMCNTKKKENNNNIERGSRVDQKFDFLNRCPDGRTETADAKISSKHDCFTIHMIDSEVGWITCV
jgi:hypothetical protein